MRQMMAPPALNLLKFAPLAFSALLPVINPIGSALLFLGLVGTAPPREYKRLARAIAYNTAALLLTVDLLGAVILNFFGISLPVVQLAGGGVLAAMGWGLLNQKDDEPSSEPGGPPTRTTEDLDASVFYPFTFPLTAGPGCIVVMLTLSAHASQHVLMNDVFAHGGILIGNLMVCALVYVSYAYAPKITQRISAPKLHGALRIIAFVLVCIGVQIAWNGLEGLVRALPVR